MARGESGRIVLEIDPSEKDELYDALIKDGLTLKHWFLRQASQYLQDRAQPSLFSTLAMPEKASDYAIRSKSGKGIVAKKKQPRRKTKAS
jgi:hypothetical protein